MSNSLLVILGNQLFPLEVIKKTNCTTIFMAEDHGLCTHYKYHKHKLIFFLTAMRKYRDELIKEGYTVHYIDGDHPEFKDSYETKLKKFLNQNPVFEKVKVFEVEDQFFELRLKSFAKTQGVRFSVLASPLFLVSRSDFKSYLAQVKKPFMKTFYERQRKAFRILVQDNGKPTGGAWSFDKDNRKKLPRSIETTSPLKIERDEVLNKVSQFVDRQFSDHPGDVDQFWFPTDRVSSEKWLVHFIENNLESFGAYQDAITRRSDFVFHSLIAPMMNVGLLLPSQVIAQVEKAYVAGKAPINSVEGFLRQVLGWREFVRGIHQNFGEQQWKSNFWNHQRKLKPCWYDGTTGIPVLDDVLSKVQRTSYAHHIERLMILSNLMLLCEIHPHQAYAWFMEMFTDSSDWVMGPNVFGMGLFSDGGIFATKPYICGSNYYLKMSDYKKGEWSETVDGLYWRFVNKNLDHFKSNPRTPFMAKNLLKMDKERKYRIFNKAEEFIENVTY